MTDARLIFGASLLAVAALWLGVVVSAGLGSARESTFWMERSAALDPPQLWSIEAVGAPPGWPPVRICTDTALRTAFIRPGPVVGDQTCGANEDAIVTSDRVAYRCTVNGTVLGASAVMAGDRTRDFTARFSVVNLSGHMMGRPGSEYEQTRRYRHLGECPDGWQVGDHTDRTGRRLRANLITGGSRALP